MGVPPVAESPGPTHALQGLLKGGAIAEVRSRISSAPLARPRHGELGPQQRPSPIARAGPPAPPAQPVYAGKQHADGDTPFARENQSSAGIPKQRKPCSCSRHRPGPLTDAAANSRARRMKRIEGHIPGADNAGRWRRHPGAVERLNPGPWPKLKKRPPRAPDEKTLIHTLPPPQSVQQRH